MSFFFLQSVTWDVVVSRLGSTNKQSLVTNGNSLTGGTRPQGTHQQADCEPTHSLPLKSTPKSRHLLQEICIFKPNYLLNALQQYSSFKSKFSDVPSSSHSTRALHRCTYQNRSDLPHVKILENQMVRPQSSV